jgi:hypothetical protein
VTLTEGPFDAGAGAALAGQLARIRSFAPRRVWWIASRANAKPCRRGGTNIGLRRWGSKGTARRKITLWANVSNPIAP